jgi:hypothetical protein
MKKLFLLFLLSKTLILHANDGAYKGSGNHIVPIYESTISINKEILTIKRVNKDFISVNVYYEFYNPKDPKKIKVGFEAMGAYGDVNGRPVNGQHPYMSNFTVSINNKHVDFETIVTDQKIDLENGLPQKWVETTEEHDMDFQSGQIDFVYLFEANFEKGINVIQHSYIYEISSSVEHFYSFDYVLSAAKRWAGETIKDFTLIIDMGEFQEFDIRKTFFSNSNEWKMIGQGKFSDSKSLYDDIPLLHTVIRTGTLIYEKENFIPSNELFISSKSTYSFDQSKYKIVPFSIDFQEYNGEPETDFEKKIYRNLAFARRGYVFKTKELQSFYEKQSWYFPNSNYIANIEQLTTEEKLFTEKYSD